MSQPSVCAILLTADRPELTRKAVECWRAQDYPNKRLAIFDTGIQPCGLLDLHCDQIGVFDCREPQAGQPRTIGELRNMAGRNITSEILVTWDSDDYSHPSRISEQVALLQSSQADCVGYSDLLFWREPRQQTAQMYGLPADPGEAWLYTSPGPKPSPPGTTLCYWRKTWERNPFAATSVGEDERFVRTCGKVFCKSSAIILDCPTFHMNDEPRMIARIHPGNTSTAYDPRKMAAESKRKNPAWQRVPAWDNFCQETMR